MAHRWDQRQPYATSAIPYIGENGNWWVNQEETGVQAQGPAGPAGKPGATGIGVAGPALTYADLTEEQKIALVAYMAEPIQEAAAEAVAAKDEVMNTLTPATELLDGVNAAAEVILAQQESATAAATRAEEAIAQVEAGAQRAEDTIAEVEQHATNAETAANRAENAASSVEGAIEVNETVNVLKDTVGYTRKNLLERNSAYLPGSEDLTINEVTFTFNMDGSVTAYGTSTAAITGAMLTVAQNTNNNLEVGERYIFSGGVSDTKRLRLYNPSGGHVIATSGSSEVAFVASGATILVVIDCPAGEVFTGETFYPMIRKADVKDATYEPYNGASVVVRMDTIAADVAAVNDKVDETCLTTSDITHTFTGSPNKVPSMACMYSLLGGLTGFKLMKAETYEANEEANGTWIENTLYVLWSEEE